MRPSIEGREGAPGISHHGRESASIAIQASDSGQSAWSCPPIPMCRAPPGALSFHQPESAGGPTGEGYAYRTEHVGGANFAVCLPAAPKYFTAIWMPTSPRLPASARRAFSGRGKLVIVRPQWCRAGSRISAGSETSRLLQRISPRDLQVRQPASELDRAHQYWPLQ